MIPIILIIIFVLIIVVGLISIPAFRLKQRLYKKTGKHPKGHYIGLGMALGIALGMPFGIAMDNPGLGPGFGLPIGLAFGIALEKKNEHKLRPLTKEEKEMQKKLVWFGVGALSIGVVVFLLVLFLMSALYPLAVYSPSPTFHSHQELVSMFKTLCDNYPSYASYDSIGKTYEGRDIWMFKFGTPNGGKVLWDGCLHGWEDMGSEIMYLFATWLLESSDPTAERILQRNYVLITDVSESMIELALAALFFKNEELAEDILEMEELMDGLNLAFEKDLLDLAQLVETPRDLTGIMRIIFSCELIADSATHIAENIIKGFEPHSILQQAIRETSEIMVREILSEDSYYKGKTYNELQDKRYKRGFHIIALKREDKWIYRFKPEFIFEESDLLIGLGPLETVMEWRRCVNPEKYKE